MKNYLLSLAILMLLAGCGYKPATAYTKESLGHTIYTAVDIPVESPEYSVAVIDSVKEAIVTRLRSKLTNQRSAADSVIEISKTTQSIASIQTNAQGVTVLYRATVTLKTAVHGKNFPKKKFTVKGTYDFPADTDSALSEQIKLDAVKEASKKAIDELISQIAIRSI